jgi:hypothetical protein
LAVRVEGRTEAEAVAEYGVEEDI